jgi:hypothetical protein
MGIPWTKKWDSTDDGAIVYGAQIGTLQDDIDVGTAGSLPVPGVTDGLKIPRVLSDHSGYELIAQVPMAAGGTGADLSAGTAGQVVLSTGTAGNMALGTAVPAFGGTGSDLSAGTAGYAVVVSGTTAGMSLSPMYSVVSVSFQSASAGHTAYCIVPIDGLVVDGWACTYEAARGATYTATLGSAGTTLATSTMSSAGIVAGGTVAFTLGTGDLTVVAGESIAVARGNQGTAGISTVSLVIINSLGGGPLIN